MSGGKLKRLISIAALFISGLFLISGCSSPNENNEGNLSYFPLNVGNRWEYSEYPDTLTVSEIWEITAEKELSGKKYFLMKRSHLKNNWSDTLYFRSEGEVVYVRDKRQEAIYADFSLALSDTVYWADPFFSDFVCSEKTIEFISFSTHFGVDYGLYLRYQRGKGLIESIVNGIFYDRKNC